MAVMHGTSSPFAALAATRPPPTPGAQRENGAAAPEAW
eukprot:CAMPEP_0202767146 /NCGR_PEP_ID=MMETSP1388-20130828/32075_1 /ASSEMBLY_ACC=CAM_ASM_000864 /TAXON_ID=37098 /ORGANISM="Isochrysis sp, Strain CCMP1244" /LENGTH=37 /DNA_ID= /DNA_START= /DNA_END= /DNA_ORIENTATION=